MTKGTMIGPAGQPDHGHIDDKSGITLRPVRGDAQKQFRRGPIVTV
jgi:hypothetical protein